MRTAARRCPADSVRRRQTGSGPLEAWKTPGGQSHLPPNSPAPAQPMEPPCWRRAEAIAPGLPVVPGEQERHPPPAAGRPASHPVHRAGEWDDRRGGLAGRTPKMRIPEAIPPVLPEPAGAAGCGPEPVALRAARIHPARPAGPERDRGWEECRRGGQSAGRRDPARRRSDCVRGRTGRRLRPTGWAGRIRPRPVARRGAVPAGPVSAIGQRGLSLPPVWGTPVWANCPACSPRRQTLR